ncbi:protein Bouncer-like [Nelusetta ayraudi]|uniref:protein Bouncer-like n=1 Tax=Nelusetta ayraudi TaxID=303726 RepID=UPI003F72125A
MKGLIFCVFLIMVLTPTQGEDEEPLEQLTESMGYEEERPFLQCFKCDLGFWDACYTTETTCVPGERCFTGRGKAGELDIKTLGCARAEECEMETTVEFLFNATVFVMTKHCCNGPFCNSAHKLESAALIYFLVAVLVTRHLAEAAAASQ